MTVSPRQWKTPNGFQVSLHLVFTALHGMQTRSSDEKAVRPSVKRVDCDKTEERSVQIFIPYKRSFSLVFREKEWLVGQPLLPKILRQPAPLERNRRFWTDRSASAVTPSEKSSINTNRKSTTRFQMSLRLLTDTSAPRHFGTTTVRHQYRMVPKFLETIRHQFFTGAELSGHQCRNTSRHFGTIRQKYMAIVSSN